MFLAKYLLMTKTAVITPRVTREINDSLCLEPAFYKDLGLDKCNEVHKAYEIIFLNLAARKGRRWQDIFKATSRNPELFSELCIAVILLDRCLRNRFKYNSSERREIMGPRFSEIIDRCKMALGSNN